MSGLAIITLVLIVINYFWTKVAHDEHVGDFAPEWINRVTDIPWLIANVVWWAFAAVNIYLSVQFYLSGEIFFVVAGALVFLYMFAMRTPKEYRNFPSAAISKLAFIPVWAMVFAGMTDGGLVYFSLFFVLWALTASVMEGRFINLTRLLSEALAEVLEEEEAEAAA